MEEHPLHAPEEHAHARPALASRRAALGKASDRGVEAHLGEERMQGAELRNIARDGPRAPGSARSVAPPPTVRVTPTYMAKGSIPEDHPLYAGIVGIQTSQRFANQLFLESDFVLAVGARFAERHTGDLDVYRGDRTFVHIDIEPGQIGRVFRPHLGIVADAKLAFDALLEAAREMTPGPGPRTVGGAPLRAALDHAAQDRLRRRADQAAEGLQGDERALRRERDQSSRPSASTRSGAVSSRRPTSPAITSAAAKPVRSGGRSPPASAPSSAGPTTWSWGSSATTPSSS